MAVEIALLKAARPDLDPDDRGAAPAHRALGAGARPGRSTRGSCRRRGPTTSCNCAGGGPPLRRHPRQTPRSKTIRLRPKRKSAEAAPPAGGDDAGPSPSWRRGPWSGDRTRRPARFVPRGNSTGSGPPSCSKLSETAPALAATFEGARPVSFGDEGLQVGFPPEHDLQQAEGRRARAPGHGGGGACGRRGGRRCDPPMSCSTERRRRIRRRRGATGSTRTSCWSG